jgi:NAD(P)-dependent dehydrogenase (short-subunit alcohol dehydrogenase family)
MKLKKVLVIGSTGLLGSNISAALKDKAEVIGTSFSERAQFKTDISDPNSLKQLFRQIGKVDAIICAAGMVEFASWEKASDEKWEHGIKNKLMGQINVVRFGSPCVRDGGAITLTTGALAQYPVPGSAIVSMVNSSVEGFVRAAGVELGNRVRVNAVSPGWIAETMNAMGMDPATGLPAAKVAEYFLDQINHGAAGSIVVAAKS